MSNLLGTGFVVFLIQEAAKVLPGATVLRLCEGLQARQDTRDLETGGAEGLVFEARHKGSMALSFWKGFMVLRS